MWNILFSIVIFHYNCYQLLIINFVTKTCICYFSLALLVNLGTLHALRVFWYSMCFDWHSSCHEKYKGTCAVNFTHINIHTKCYRLIKLLIINTSYN